MSALQTSGMDEGQPGETHYLIAIMSVLLPMHGGMCCVKQRTFYRSSVLVIAARVTE
ncbi:hypothetical protein D3C75_309620 [compost metagenome]